MGTDDITGANLIAGRPSRDGSETFRALHPVTGEQGGTLFHVATDDEVSIAAQAAYEAYRVTRSWDTERIGALLDGAAEELEAFGDRLIATANAESGLGEKRLTGELARTCGQLRMFGAYVRSGRHLDAIIDHADASTTPPRPDLRRMKVALGPVAVFGASNFPLAFSVPGGDTASALASGCAVVVKAHPSHPATSELSARALLRAAERVDAPEGLISLVHGPGTAVGRALVLSEPIRAVGFTGSTGGGLALHRLAAGRDQPIPVHAEMGSVNPVIVTPAAITARADEIASGFATSVTMGTGQFCTKPGLLFVPEGSAGDEFVDSLAAIFHETEPGVLLNAAIQATLDQKVSETRDHHGVTTLVAPVEVDGARLRCSPSLLSVGWSTYCNSPDLRDEHFGPIAIVVRFPFDELHRVPEVVDGSLTITVQAEEQDIEAMRGLRADLVDRAGRVLWNGFPTGVAVVAAQHHGGPFPSTTDSRHTSVGARAIERFLRPVTFQDTPEDLLPAALRESNPLGIQRLVDGVLRT